MKVITHQYESLVIKGRELLPIVQGGMGVGVSAHRLAGSVAALGALGTISSVDLRRHHPDLMERTDGTRDKDAINAANLVALDREVRAARELSGGRGMLAVNVMRAVSKHAAYVRRSCETGVDALVV
ncbi:MAG: nitronate monooxygenase, partial [Burkholderiaceae bacterium]|nr:nitronate monooxygenase [Burkholderiaceae bacterium]